MREVKVISQNFQRNPRRSYTMSKFIEEYYREQVKGTTPNWEPGDVAGALKMLALIEESKHPCQNCGAKECDRPKNYCFDCLRIMGFFTFAGG